MATANPLEDQISCSVCSDIYKQPHLLNTCLHTFCLECIQQLEKGGRITCPECRKVTERKDIRRDFKIQGVIDAYRVQHEDIAHNVGSRTCESELKKLEYDFVKIISSVEKRLTEVDSNIAEVGKQQMQQLKDVDQYTKQVIEELQKNQTHIEKLIHDANANVLSHLKMQKENLTNGRKELQEKINFLKDLIKTQDSTTLTETTPIVKENMLETLTQIKASLPDVSSNMKSPVHVKRGENWDVKGSIEVTVGDTEGTMHDVTFVSEAIQPVLESLYSELQRSLCLKVYSTGRYQKVYSRDLQFWPDKLKEINRQIWCCGGDTVGIFNQECQQVKQFTYERMKRICSLTETPNNDIIVASDSGLHLIDVSGQYKTQVAEGKFSDVCVYNNMVYALKYNKTKVCVLTYNHGKWQFKTDFKLCYYNGDGWDKMCVNEAGIYISSCSNHSIYIHSFQGQLQLQVQGTSKLILCGVDGDRNILVVDRSNDKVKVRHPSGKWNDMQILGGINGPGPMCVLLDHYGALWVVTGDSVGPKTITKYRKL